MGAAKERRLTMAGRPDAIGRRAPLPVEYEDLRDPANGERVPRCGACGVPSRTILRGTWAGKAGMWFPVCSSCMARWNGPQRTDTDPLSVEDVA